jgi:four helix bundle protein
MLPYERFDAWHSCHALTIVIYRVTGTWPREELHGLVSQARRAAFSAAANICEGSARRGPREFRRFLDITLGSLSELAYIVRLATDLGFLGPKDSAEIEELRSRAGKQVWGLYRSARDAPASPPS